MNSIKINFVQTLKVWWSFVWRTWVLMFPPMIVLGFIMVKIMPLPKPGDPASPAAGFAQNFGLFMLIYVVMLAAMIVTQVFALQWTLKTRWSDFKLLAVAEKPVEPQQLHMDR